MDSCGNAKLIRVQWPELQVGNCGLATELVEGLLARMASHKYLDVYADHVSLRTLVRR